jgi:hypothetical protein
METKKSSRTFVIGAVAGVLVALALGGAFLLGRAGGAESRSPGLASAAPGDTATENIDGAAGATVNDGVDASQPESSDDTDEDDNGEISDEATATPTATATATATPSGECAHCVDGDIAAEPTPADPCPLCNGDLDIALPVDMPPSIGDVTTSFCYPNLVLFFELEDADVVWFSFSAGGATHDSQHIDADTFQGFLSKDMAYLSWDAYFITNLRVHAKDDQGHHVWSEQIDAPDPDLAC